MARKPPLEASSVRGAGAGATRASAVYEQLRADITHGVLEPGAKLRVQAMCLRYGVGASPLREALSRLSAERLVERTDQRGFRVATIDWDELPGLTRNRIQLESLALEESIAARDAEWEHGLALLVHQLSRTPRSLAEDHYVPNPEWEALHRDFHRALLMRSPSRWLRAFCDTLMDEAYRYRQLAAGQAFGSRSEHDEHVAIFHAAINGDAAQAQRLLADHYLRTADVVLQRARGTKGAA